MNRRARFAAISTLIGASAAASAFFLVVLGDRFDLRFDATATGMHELSPRTRAALGAVGEGAFEVIAAVDSRQVGTDARRRFLDVIDQFHRERSGIGGTFLDTGSAGGLDQARIVLGHLVDRDAAEIARQAEAIEAAAMTAEQFAASMGLVSSDLLRLKDLIEAGPAEAGVDRSRIATHFSQRAELARLSSLDLPVRVAEARAALSAPMPTIPAPALDRARDAIAEPLRSLAVQLDALGTDLAALREARIAEPARELAASLAKAIAPRRDEAALVADGLRALTLPDSIRVGRVLETTQAAIVVGPPGSGATAIPISDLFPPAGVGPRADHRRRMEELIATAIQSLSRPVRPIIVLTHAQPAAFTPDDWAAFEALRRRLGMMGGEVIEWATAVDAAEPDVRRLDPSGTRPVVFVALSPDNVSGSVGGSATGPERARTLGRALRGVVEAGRPLLLSLNPSTMPTYGDVDPIAAAMEPFGLAADSGRPLLREIVTATGRVVEPTLAARAEGVEHPLSQAIEGLPVLLTWPVPLRIEPGDASHGVALLEASGPGIWSEAEWLGYWQTPTEQRAMVRNAPTPDARRDGLTGPWPVALAATREIAGQEEPARIVVVGSNGWFLDQVTQARDVVDGRSVPVYPGNMELFEGAVLWLAGRDELIARSVEAIAVPIVEPIEPSRLALWRWLAVAGLPGLVLLLGAAWRVVRG